MGRIPLLFAGLRSAPGPKIVPEMVRVWQRAYQKRRALGAPAVTGTIQSRLVSVRLENGLGG